MSRYDLDLFSDPLHTPAQDEGEGETWMMSYLDVMTLLIAFFVLLLALSNPGANNDHVRNDADAPRAEASAPASLSPQEGAPAAVAGPVGDTATSVLENRIGLLPAYNAVLPGRSGETLPDASGQGMTDSSGLDDYQARFGALEDSLNSLSLQGVDATPGREGLTLRIADNLLFASGDAELSYDGMLLISQLQEVLASFRGEISIEGHTDTIPISTVRFPSNWELSSARAISVLRYLEFGGLQADRMRA